MDLIGAMYNLKEQALRKSEMESDLRQMMPRLIQHLIKCFIWKDTTGDLNHWCSEIAAFYQSVPKLKNTKKFPTYKYLMNITIEKFEDVLNDRIKLTVEDLLYDGYKEIDYSANRVYNQIIEYFKWISNELSIKGMVSKSDIYKEVTKLINE